MVNDDFSGPAPRGGDPRLWFTWAIRQFWFFAEAPAPLAFGTTEGWVRAFDTWAALNLSETCAWIAGFLLGFYNDGRKWRCARGTLHRHWANMDDGNRRACVRVLEHARFF